MSEPTIDDIRRFEKKVYLLCIAGVAAGAVLANLLWHKQSTFAGIALVAGIILCIISLVMLGFFINFFWKLKAKMQEPWEPPKKDQDSQK